VEIDFFSTFISRVRARILRYLGSALGFHISSAVSVFKGEYFSSNKIEVLKNYSNSFVYETTNLQTKQMEGYYHPPRSILRAQDVQIDSQTGIVFQSNFKAIAESSAWPQLWLTINSIPRPLFPKKLGLRTGTKYILFPSNGFYHSIIEDLPAFLFQLRSSGGAEILVYKESNLWIIEILDFLNAEYIKIPRFVSMDSFEFPQKNGSTGWPHPEDIRILRDVFQGSASTMSTTRKVYVSRLKSSRSPSFEARLESDLKSNGWEIVYAENESFLSQIEIFSSASVIAGVHGAGLSGMVWMKNGSKVIELSPSRYVPCYTRLADICDLNYLRIEIEREYSSYEEILDKIMDFSMN